MEGDTRRVAGGATPRTTASRDRIVGPATHYHQDVSEGLATRANAENEAMSRVQPRTRKGPSLLTRVDKAPSPPLSLSLSLSLYSLSLQQGGAPTVRLLS
jgi:hypothetical protein